MSISTKELSLGIAGSENGEVTFKELVKRFVADQTAFTRGLERLCLWSSSEAVC
jgi:hypothetical protein